MADISKDELFAHPEEKKEPTPLVSFIKSPEEEKRLIAQAEEARKRAEELLKDPEKAKEPIELVSFAKDQTTDGSDKTYLLLFEGFEKDSEKEVHDWLIAKGRRQAYEFIKMYMENEDIFYDLKKSKILVDVEKLEQAKSQYDFMNWIIENDIMGKDEIYPHVDDYDYLDEEEEDLYNGEE